MLPGHSQILTCPFCGAKKEVMSLMSGNTIGAEYWSDNKRIAPMLPEVSYVQQCPQCKKYYIMDRQEEVLSEDSWSGEQGLLTFAQTKKAFAQLSQEGFQGKNEEAQVRLMLHHAYNDYYHRKKRRVPLKNPVNEKDDKLFRDNALWLIDNYIKDNLLKAEYYREIGEFEKAADMLKSVNAEEQFQKELVASIQQRLEQKDCVVFKIQ